MFGVSRLAIKTTLWRVGTLRQRRYTSGQTFLDIKQQISRHLYHRQNTSFFVRLWNRALCRAAVMYKQGWRYVGCHRPSLLSSPHSSLTLSCYLQPAAGVYCVINLLPCQSARQMSREHTARGEMPAAAQRWWIWHPLRKVTETEPETSTSYSSLRLKGRGAICM